VIAAQQQKVRPHGASWWDDEVAALRECAPGLSQEAVAAVRQVLTSLAFDPSSDQATLADVGTLLESVCRHEEPDLARPVRSLVDPRRLI
jgi:hypothetical protein